MCPLSSSDDSDGSSVVSIVLQSGYQYNCTNTYILSSLDKYKPPYEMKSDLIVSVDINNAEQHSMW